MVSSRRFPFILSRNLDSPEQRAENKLYRVSSNPTCLIYSAGTASTAASCRYWSLQAYTFINVMVVLFVSEPVGDAPTSGGLLDTPFAKDAHGWSPTVPVHSVEARAFPPCHQTRYSRRRGSHVSLTPALKLKITRTSSHKVWILWGRGAAACCLGTSGGSIHDMDVWLSQPI
ncbi:hypothetical protein VUR80DRAFT_234 [Thermomyces stellatus]